MSRIPILITCSDFTKSTVRTTGSMCTSSQKPGDNFTNILRSDLVVNNFLRSFSLLTVWLCNFLAEEYWHKSCLENIGENDYR